MKDQVENLKRERGPRNQRKAQTSKVKTRLLERSAYIDKVENRYSIILKKITFVMRITGNIVKRNKRGRNSVQMQLEKFS